MLKSLPGVVAVDADRTIPLSGGTSANTYQT